MTEREWVFDSNTPPQMPLSALLYSPMWMRFVHCYEPWMVYPMMRHSRRDARSCAHWLHFYVVLHTASVNYLMWNPGPVYAVRENCDSVVTP